MKQLIDQKKWLKWIKKSSKTIIWNDIWDINIQVSNEKKIGNNLINSILSNWENVSRNEMH